mmetsp:Transcript_14561/g.31771  ORF Transcript_14561/g.31771 Transcript_14561/m.31771 type:complete len:595 (+) Transcript_14561:377-2161(+)
MQDTTEINTSAAASNHNVTDEETGAKRTTVDRATAALQTSKSTRRDEADFCVDENEDFTDETQRTKSNHHPPESSGSKPDESSFATRPICWEYFKYAYSCALLLLSTILVSAILWTGQTNTSLPGGAAFGIVIVLLAWLAILEGGQGALVGLQPVDPQRFQTTHPRAFQIARLIYTKRQNNNNNLERFLLGRQFLVVGVVFVINLVASASDDASLLSSTMPSWWEKLERLLMQSGLALMLTTVMLVQLTAQINAADCCLDVINNVAMLVTTYASLGMEAVGLLHCVYWVKILLKGNEEDDLLLSEEDTGNEVEKQQPGPLWKRILFWIQVVASTALLGFSLAATLTALIQEKTATSLPPAVAILILVLLLCLVGILEGLQIALFAVVKLPSETREGHKMAATNCSLAFRNFGALLIGRQILVTLCMFIIARITSIQVEDDEDDDSSGGGNIFGVSNATQEFFNTGLLGAMITTILASLVWRIVASSFPLAFLSNPVVFVLLHVCLALEQSGICSASWLLARLCQKVAGLQSDDVYLGAASSASSKPSHDENANDPTTVTMVSTTMKKSAATLEDVESLTFESDVVEARAAFPLG